MAPSLRGLSLLASLALVSAEYNASVLELAWSFDCKLDSETGPIDLVKDKGYYACADIEFCQVSESQFAYRLPGRPCLPLKSPLIRVTAGKKYHLTLHNVAYDPSVHCNLHTHGPHISGDGNSDNVERRAYPGEALRYTWDIIPNHPSGTFWYHDHSHQTTFLHVHGGAVGPFVVDEDEVNDPYFNLSPDFARFLRNEVLLVGANIDGNYFGNGNCKEVLPAVQGEWFRWRFAGANPFPQVKPTLQLLASSAGKKCMAYPIAHDGVFTWKIPQLPWAGNGVVVNGNTWSVTGASRIDLAVNCPSAGDYDVIWGGGKVGTFQVRPGVRTSATPWKPGNKQWDTINECNPVILAKTGRCVKGLRPDYNADLRAYKGPVNKWLIEPLSAGIKYNGNLVQLYDPPTPNKVVAFNEVQEWTIRSTSGHPFHLHVYHMQVVTPGGCGPRNAYGELYDTIYADKDCTVRFRTTNYTGRVIFHCHLLKHEDAGTMGWVNVLDGPGAIPVDYFQAAPINETNTYSARWNTFGPSWAGYTSATCVPDNKCYPSQQCSLSGVDIMNGVDRCGNVCTLGSPLFSTCAYLGIKGATCGAGNLCRSSLPPHFANPSLPQTPTFCGDAPVLLTVADETSAASQSSPANSNLVWLAFLAVPAVLLLAVPAFLIWRRRSSATAHEQLELDMDMPSEPMTQVLPSLAASPPHPSAVDPNCHPVV